MCACRGLGGEVRALPSWVRRRMFTCAYPWLFACAIDPDIGVGAGLGEQLQMSRLIPLLNESTPWLTDLPTHPSRPLLPHPPHPAQPTHPQRPHRSHLAPTSLLASRGSIRLLGKLGFWCPPLLPLSSLFAPSLSFHAAPHHLVPPRHMPTDGESTALAAHLGRSSEQYNPSSMHIIPHPCMHMRLARSMMWSAR